MPPRRRALDPAQVAAARAAYDDDVATPADLKLLTRATLARLEEAAPGRSVEVRVPPYGAVQVIAGVRHTRGTPPAVVETDPATWLALATGRLPWAKALASGAVRASGERADLAPYLPVRDLP